MRERGHNSMVDERSLPPDILESQRAVLWNRELRGGKPAKVPYQVNCPTAHAKVDHPETWGSFRQALIEVECGRAVGAGIVLGDGMAGVDLDHCRSTQTGAIESWAQRIIEEIDSYTEVSPSGEGVHILVRGDLPPGRRRKGNIEMYCDGRYFTVTGSRVEGTRPTIEERTSRLANLHASVFPKATNGSGKASSTTDEDEDLILRAKRARNGAKFSALFAGDTSEYSSPSEADLSLVNLLAFWTGRNAARMDRLFRKSGLMRPKWDERRGEKSYGDRTIETAVANCRQFYSGNGTTAEPALGADFKIPGIITARGRTDSANALRLIARHGDDTRYCPGWGKYLIWNGTQWEPDAAHRIEALAKDSSSALWQEIVEAGKAGADKSTLSAMTSFARKSSDGHGLRETIWAARSDQTIQADHTSFDADPLLLNVLNGTLDLETGTLREHSRNDLITKVAPVRFDPSAKCPIWERFLTEVFQPALELVAYLQRAFGYSLTASTVERCLFFLLGVGLNGKTTAVTTLQKLLGSYATSITTEFLMLAYGQQHPTEMCDLAGVRMAVAAETEDGRRFAESLIKTLTGGEDRLKGRRMREDFWEFTATHKLWLTGNHKPKVSTSDEAIWDRLRIIPFTVRFENPDRSLAKKLEQELPGILNWAITGCLDWQRDGLPTPPVVEKAAVNYRQEMDALGAFLDECCLIDEKCQAGATALFTRYKLWGGDLTQKAFGTALAERRFISHRFKSGQDKGRKYWRGIALVDDGVNDSE